MPAAWPLRASGFIGIGLQPRLRILRVRNDGSRGARSSGLKNALVNCMGGDMFLTTGPKPDACRRPGRRRRGVILGLVIAPVLATVAYATATAAPNEGQVKAGLEIWKSSGCADCHGPFADGDKQR